METPNSGAVTSSQSDAVTSQARVSVALDHASEMQQQGKISQAASELEDAMSIAQAAPYEIEFMTRVRLGTMLADAYLSLERVDDARNVATSEAAFADKINQIMQATGTPAQKRAAMAGYLQVRDRATQLRLIGESAPELAVKQWLAGEPASIASSRGRVLLVEFWATWCKPCQEMFPKLNLLHEQHSPRGMDIVALTRHYLAYRGTTEAMADELELMRKMVADHDVRFSVGVAEDEGLQTIYGANGLPTMFLIDREGVVRYAGAGGDEAAFLSMLDRYLST